MQIIDAHQHVWDLKVFPQDWTSGPIRRSFLPKHLAPLLKKAGVDRTVFVQPFACDSDNLSQTGRTRAMRNQLQTFLVSKQFTIGARANTPCFNVFVQ